MTDYSRLAQQFGGQTSTTPADIDYEALARQYGAAPALAPNVITAEDYTKAVQQRKQNPSTVERLNQYNQPLIPIKMTDIGNAAAGGFAGAGSIGATLMRPFESAEANKQRREGIKQGFTELGVDPNSLSYGGGKIGGELAGTAGMGGLLAKGAASIPLLAKYAPGLIEALRTSGMSAGGATGAGGVAARMAGGAATGAASAGAINPEDAKSGAMIGAAAPVVIKAAGTVGGQLGNMAAAKYAERVSAFNKNAPKNETIRKALDVGYQIPPNMVKPTFANQAIESVSGKQATEQLASVHNAQVTDSLARKALGLAEDAPLTKESMQGYRNAQHVAGYEPVRQLGTVKTDKEFTQALDNVSAKYTGKGTIPAVQRNDIKEIVDSHKSGSFDSGDAVDAMRLLRESADEAFRKGDTSIAKAYKDISKAYEDVIERNLQKSGQPELLDAFKSARQNMAKSFTVENAIVEGSGGINPQKLAAELQKGKPLEGDLLTAAQFANTFKKVAKPLEQVGSPAAHNLKAVTSAGFGGSAAGLGFMLGGPALSATMGTAAAAYPFVAPPLARALMFRKAAQQGLVEKAPTAANYQKLANLLQDPEKQQLLMRSAPILGTQ